MELLKRLWVEEEGQTFTEYGLILGLVSVLLAATLLLFKDALVGVFNDVISKL